MKKIIIKFSLVSIMILMLCGCSEQKENKYSEETNYMGSRFTIYVDDETCVEYFVSNGSYNSGNVLPRYNENGTLKLNHKCIEDKKGE